MADLDPRTLRYVARRMRKYERHYDGLETPKFTQSAFNAGVARMASKAADECLGTAGAIERKRKMKRKSGRRAR